MAYRRYIRGIEQVTVLPLELNPFWEIFQEFCSLPPRVGYSLYHNDILSMVGYKTNRKIIIFNFCFDADFFSLKIEIISIFIGRFGASVPTPTDLTFWSIVPRESSTLTRLRIPLLLDSSGPVKR